MADYQTWRGRVQSICERGFIQLCESGEVYRGWSKADRDTLRAIGTGETFDKSLLEQVRALAESKGFSLRISGIAC